MGEPGYCQCGCGQRTTVARQNHRRYGWVKGQPKRFVRGHGGRRRGPDYVEEDRGHDTPCWIFQGSKLRGYGQMGDGAGRVRLAHRLFYERLVGPIPKDHQLDHLCKQTDCVNPAHLEPAPPVVNVERSRVAKLSRDQVRQIRAAYRPGLAEELASAFGIGRSTLFDIVARRTWRHV